MDIYTKDIRKPKSSAFSSIKLFVLCHGLLQLTQLLYSSYFKSTITTIERRFGLNSLSSGTISSLHEVGNTVLIVFISYLGSRVHRPRLIGLGGLLMSISALILTLPHFLSKPYKFDTVLKASRYEMCSVPAQSGNFSTKACGQQDSRVFDDNTKLWVLMAIAQLLFGIGSVPIQPFGISYVDDFAGPGNSPLYIAILFAVSVFGPAFGFLLGSGMLRIYVDVDRVNPAGVNELTPADPRWVGAWWMGLLISAGGLFITSIPYFFFPRAMHVENKEVVKDTDGSANVSVLEFLKMFPRLFVRLLLSPLFLLLVLTQCCFSSVVAGLATFLNKFLERQYGATAAFSSLLIGAVNLPSVAIGMLLGGVVMKHWGLSLKAIPRFCIALLCFSVLLCVPLFFMGCSTQTVANVYPQTATTGHVSCSPNCLCPEGIFNPVCGENQVEYISPCHAGCTNFKMKSGGYRVMSYSNCSCVSVGSGVGSALPGPCANNCPKLLLPVIFLISIAALVASLTHNPMYMMVLRVVPQEEKSFAIGVQFLLMRILAWLPAPALFGMTIDSTCIWWKKVCGKTLGCGYYDNHLLRNRYLGLQVAFKVMGIALLTLIGWKVGRTSQYNLGKKPDEPQ